MSSAEPQAQGLPEVQDLSGVWKKDSKASDSMGPLCDIMKFGKLMRTAVGLSKGVEIRQQQGQFELDMLSGVLWFRLRERYPLSGEPVQVRRRDLRSGTARGWVERSPSSGGKVITAEWGEPYGGSNQDHFYLQSPGVLVKETKLTVHGQEVLNRTVFRRTA